MGTIQNNPQYVVGIVRVLALLLVIIGLPALTDEQEAALVVVISLVLTVITSKVTVPKAPTPDAPPKSIQTS